MSSQRQRDRRVCVSPHVDVSFSAAVPVLVQHNVTVSSLEPTRLTVVQQNLLRAFHTPHLHTHGVHPNVLQTYTCPSPVHTDGNTHTHHSVLCSIVPKLILKLISDTVCG